MSRTTMPDGRRLAPVPEPAPDAPEHQKAVYWRVNVMRLTQDGLARLLGVRRSTVWRYESGEQPITRMYRLACLGLMSWRPWNPAGWPYWGDEKHENEVFKRLLREDPDDMETAV